MTWTKSQIKFITENHLDMSRAELAERIGKSRNAVIGKLNRMGLCIKHDTKKPKSKPKKKIEHVARVSSNGLDNIKPKSCRFPEGDYPFTFCGADISKGSYCQKHYNICYRKGTVE